MIGDHVTRMEEMRNAYKILIGNLECKRQTRDRLIWEDNVELDLNETGFGDVD